MVNKYGLLKDFGIAVTEFSAIHQLLKYSSDVGIPVKSDGSMFWITRKDPFTRKEILTPNEFGAVKDLCDNVPPKQERYQGKSGEDLIDRWARESTPEVFRIKIMAQFDRYTSRYGKKDEPLIEAKKLQDYANRLVQYEENLIKEEG